MITVLIDSSETFPLVTPSHLRIDNLEEHTNYTFSIYAVNDAGLSPGIIFTGQTNAAGNELISRDILFVLYGFRNMDGGGGGFEPPLPLLRLNFYKIRRLWGYMQNLC